MRKQSQITCCEKFPLNKKYQSGDYKSNDDKFLSQFATLICSLDIYLINKGEVQKLAKLELKYAKKNIRLKWIIYKHIFVSKNILIFLISL